MGRSSTGAPMTKDPFDQLMQLIRHAPDPLVCAFERVESMSEAQATETWHRLHRECAVPSGLVPMLPAEADLCQALAAKLNIRLRWKHAHLNKEGGWQDGRGEG